MSDMCDDNRFELIEKYKKKLLESTNIETSPDEMKVLDDILFRFWQMGWLDSLDRMLLVKESAKTLMHSVGDSVSAKAFRNAGRFMQNAIDGEAPEFEMIPPAQPQTAKQTDESAQNVPNGDSISRKAAIDAYGDWYVEEGTAEGFIGTVKQLLEGLPSVQPKSYKEKLKEIADALSEKFAYMNTCLNERDIILGYLGVKRPSEIHCNTDCTNVKCESHCCYKKTEKDATRLLSLPADVQPVVRCKDCVYWSSKETRYCNMLQGTFQENDYCSYGEQKG